MAEAASKRKANFRPLSPQDQGPFRCLNNFEAHSNSSLPPRGIRGLNFPRSTQSPGFDEPRKARDSEASGIRGGMPDRSEERTARILVVDDEAANRMMLADLISHLGYHYKTAENGEVALGCLPDFQPDLICLDLRMPVLDGFETLKRIKENPETRHIPVIIVSGVSQQESVVRCLEHGADDYLAKPFNVRILQARLEASLRKKHLFDLERRYHRQMEEHNSTLERRVREQVEQITTAQTATIFALSKLAESRDFETGQHLERITAYCEIIAQALRDQPGSNGHVTDDFIRTLKLASPLHDIGKVGIPDNILKKPGPLTAEEFEVMKTHAEIGARTLEAVHKKHPRNALINMGIAIAESHHERWDGTGYPRGLAEEEIPLCGRILALADVYDALSTRRCYKEAFSHEESRAILLDNRGSQFDPAVVDAFLAREEQFVDVLRHLGDH